MAPEGSVVLLRVLNTALNILLAISRVVLSDKGSSYLTMKFPSMVCVLFLAVSEVDDKVIAV